MERTPGKWVYNGLCSIVAMQDGREAVFIASTREKTAGLPLAPRQEEIANGEYLAAAPALANCLRDIYGLIERGDLVRNVSRDNEPSYAMRMTILVGALHRAHTLLNALGYQIDDCARPLADNFVEQQQGGQTATTKASCGCLVDKDGTIRHDYKLRKCPALDAR